MLFEQRLHLHLIILTFCFGAQTQFTIANTGGVSFSWTATASSAGERVSPASGTLGGGKRQVVSVSRIMATGTITVTAPRARNAPQRVTITCRL
jgi:hypothetical protein